MNNPHSVTDTPVADDPSADETFYPLSPLHGEEADFTIPNRRRRHIWDAGGHIWKPHQLAEWEKRLAFVNPETIKKTFLATTQLVPSVQHENEMYPKDAQGARFAALSCRRLNEIVYCDLVKFPRTSVKQQKPVLGLLFYCGSSKITALFPLGTDESSSKTLEHCFEFVRDFGCPTELRSDYANNLCKAKSWKRFTGIVLVTPATNEPNKSQSNYVERAWQDIQRRGGTRIQGVDGPKGATI